MHTYSRGAISRHRTGVLTFRHISTQINGLNAPYLPHSLPPPSIFYFPSPVLPPHHPWLFTTFCNPMLCCMDNGYGTLFSGPGSDFLQGWKWFLSFPFIPKAGVKDHPEIWNLPYFALGNKFFFFNFGAWEMCPPCIYEHLAYISVYINFQRFGVSKKQVS